MIEKSLDLCLQCITKDLAVGIVENKEICF